MSKRITNTGGQVTCLMCETPNPAKAHQCKVCNAPMALVQDVLQQKEEPRLISLLGDSNAGKTVYLGFLLDMLAQRANEFEAVPQGAYSVDVQQRVISYMAHRMFPPKTPMESNAWSWAYVRVRHAANARWLDLVMPDLAGEAIAAEVTNPATFNVIRNLLSMSSGTILLVDAALAANGSTRPDFFGLKMLSYIDSLFGGKRGRQVEMPIAVVLAKADHCPECFEDPVQFVRANFNRFWNLCASRFRNVEFFACSVVGSLAYAVSARDEVVTPIPLHTALRGVLEPFEWIAERL